MAAPHCGPGARALRRLYPAHVADAQTMLTRLPKSVEALVATTVRTIFQQPSAEAVHAQHARVVEQLDARFPEAAAMLAEAAPEVLAFTACPLAHWKQVWSNNPLERLL